MKILEIDYDHYYYPNNITCIEEFITSLSIKNTHTYVNTIKD